MSAAVKSASNVIGAMCLGATGGCFGAERFLAWAALFTRVLLDGGGLMKALPAFFDFLLCVRCITSCMRLSTASIFFACFLACAARFSAASSSSASSTSFSLCSRSAIVLSMLAFSAPNSAVLGRRRIALLAKGESH